MTTFSLLSAGGLASYLTIRWGSAQPAPPKKHTCICTHLCFPRHTGPPPLIYSSPVLHIHPVTTPQAQGASVRRHLLTANLSYNQCPSYRKPSMSASPLPSHPLTPTPPLCCCSRQAETMVDTILHSSPAAICLRLCPSTDTAFSPRPFFFLLNSEILKC